MFYYNYADSYMFLLASKRVRKKLVLHLERIAAQVKTDTVYINLFWPIMPLIFWHNFLRAGTMHNFLYLRPEEVGSDHVYLNKRMMSRIANSIPLR